jgi:hypothetical protein
LVVPKELESAANVSVEHKTLEIQCVRTELEDKLRSEHSQTVRLSEWTITGLEQARAQGRGWQTTHRLRLGKASQAACRW